MKLFCAFIFFLSASILFAQQKLKKGSYWGFKTGANFSQMSGDRHLSFNKKGFEGGMFVRVNLTKKISGQVEVLCVQKGVVKRSRNSRINPIDINLWYFQVPILVQVPYKKWLFEAGLAYGLLFLQEQRKDEFLISKGWKFQPFKTYESSFNVGFQYFLSPQCALNVRYSNSILPVRIKIDGYDPYFYKNQFNNVLSVTFTARFKTKIEKAKKFKE